MICSTIFNADFEFNEEDPFLDPVGLESGLTMTKKKTKRTLTVDEKIKAVLNEESMKTPKLKETEEMEIDEIENENNSDSGDDNIDELDIEAKDNVRLKQTTLKVFLQTLIET